jgi:broad specificity phosphatase PhoE
MPCFFITHPEVVIEPAVPIESWALSETGAERATFMAEKLHGRVRTIVSSTERKATDTAAIIAGALGLPTSTDESLGEMDRRATGYLPPAEFEVAVDAFFAHPHRSFRGWERAIDAQRRIVRAVQSHLRPESDDRIAFIAHGGVGGLLLASLTAAPIDRALDQPGLGSYFTFDARSWQALTRWQRITP